MGLGESQVAPDAGVIMTADEKERVGDGMENYFEQARSHFFGVQTGTAHTNTAMSSSYGSNTSNNNNSSSSSSSSSSRVTDGQPDDIPSHPNSFSNDSTRGSPIHTGGIPSVQSGNSLNADESPKSKGFNEFSINRDRDSSSEKKRKIKLMYVNFVKRIPKNGSSPLPLNTFNENDSYISHSDGQQKRYRHLSDPQRLDYRLEAPHPHSMSMSTPLHNDSEAFRDAQRVPPVHQSIPFSSSFSSSSSSGVPMRLAPPQLTQLSSQQRVVYGEHSQSHGHWNSSYEQVPVKHPHSAAGMDTASMNDSNGHPSSSSSSVAAHVDGGLSVLLLALSAPQGSFPPPPPIPQLAASTPDFPSHTSTSINSRTTPPHLGAENAVRSYAGAGKESSEGSKSLTTRTLDPL